MILGSKIAGAALGVLCACAWLALLLALSYVCTGCVHTPTPDDPARCSIGASASHSRGHSLGEPNADITVTAWSSCDL